LVRKFWHLSKTTRRRALRKGAVVLITLAVGMAASYAILYFTLHSLLSD
jgi:hypothetical protein